MFYITFKLNSYQMSISRRGPLTPSTSTFPNIDLAKTVGNLLAVSNLTKKMATIISISILTPVMRDKKSLPYCRHFLVVARQQEHSVI